MVRSIFQTVLIAILLCLFAGCSLDRVQLISQPSAAKPGDTISVLLTDIYLIISTAPATSQAYSRDSLHVAYGMPAGWGVLSSDYYVATGIKMGQMASIMNNPSLLSTLIQDSLALYMQRKSPMTRDAGWRAIIAGATYTAHNFANNDSISVTGSAVGQWIAYSGRINLSVPGGTKMDTGVALTALPIDSVTRGRIKAFYRTDSIWVKALPVICFAQLIAGQATETDTLLYFSKTGTKPGPSSPLNFDKGDMTYAPININPNNAVRLMPVSQSPRALLRVSARPAATTRIEVGGLGGGIISICDMAGRTIRTFDALQNAAIVWDRTTSSGARVGTGTFAVRYESRSGIAVQTVRIVK